MADQDKLVEVFEEHAKSVLGRYPQLQAHWETISRGRGRRLTIPKQDEEGFDVIAEAHTYGLYAFADKWLGPAWEPLRREEVNTLCAEFMDFGSFPSVRRISAGSSLCWSAPVSLGDLI